MDYVTSQLAVGWCALAPGAELAWLSRARYLRPPDDLPVWSIQHGFQVIVRRKPDRPLMRRQLSWPG